ncbi:cytochrome c oxidase subunit 3 [soil metagenome]
MELEQTQLPENVQQFRVHPQKFALWVGLSVLSMAFAALTSAYLVRQAAPNWLEFTMPVPFIWSAIIMVFSSISMQVSVWAFKKEKIAVYNSTLVVTILLALTFLVSQYLGYKGLEARGIYLNGNPSGSFVYVISYLHIAHVLGGIIPMLVALVRSLWKFGNPEKLAAFKSNGNRRVGIELLATYWHFVDILWIYLLLFFMFS